MRLKKLMVAAIEKVRDAQSILASVKSYEMQRQQLDQQERIARQLQMIIDKQQGIEQPQEEDGRVSSDRRPFRPSETEPTNIGEGPAAGEDPPIERNINEEDRNAAEVEWPAVKQTVVKGVIASKVEATSKTV